jgi:hypothetical protein
MPIERPPTNPLLTKNRNAVLKEIRARFGAEEAHTRWLTDALIAAWDTRDQFTSIFGAEMAQSYLQAGFEADEEEQENDEHEHQ